MNKRILLVTLWGFDNFGNRLQNLALKRLIEDMGYDVTCAQIAKDDFWMLVERKIKEGLGWIGVSKYRKNYIKKYRTQALKKDIKLFEPMTPVIYRGNTIGKIDPEKYDVAVTGSDQVWHRWSKWNDLSLYYLSFMPFDKRISYAASFGFDAFPERDYQSHQEGLLGMRFISCREENGCTLVEQMTGKAGKLVLDPTLCVDGQLWRKLEKEPLFRVPRRYGFVFMLGDKQQYLNSIQEYSRKKQIELIDLNDFSHKESWGTSLGGFLWLVHHAEIIFTDSFHCTVFSILYEKKFVAFQRDQRGMENMFGRIETLLSKIGLEEEIYNGISLEDRNINYAGVNYRLDNLRADSTEWLRDTLKTVCMS